jgi:hypothetical protein
MEVVSTSLRIICEHCSGELQVPRTSAGKRIRCPLCETVFTAAPLMVRSSTAEAPTWSPSSEEDLDNPIPWYILLGAIAPAGMLVFVAHEPIAFAVAAVLVMIALFVATRREWSRWSRFMGVVSLSLLAFAAAAAVNLYAHGNFAQLGLHLPVSSGDSDRSPPSELEHVVWKEFASPDANFSMLFPGPVVGPTRDIHPSGLEIVAYEAKFPKSSVTFAVRTFKIPTARFDERGEELNLNKMNEIVPWLFFEGDAEKVKKGFYFEHPRYDYEFFALDRIPGPGGKLATVIKSAIACQAYLVRDRAYLVSVSAAKYEPIKPLADKFLMSFRLSQLPPAMRAASTEEEPDWKALNRPAIPKVKPVASYRGHAKPPIMLLAFSRDGKHMITGSGHEHVIRWNLETGYGTRVAGAENYVYFAVNPTGKEMVAAVPNGFAAPEIFFLVLEHTIPELGPANTDYIGFSADNKTAFVALDRQITAWEETRDGKEKINQVWSRPTDAPLTRIAVSRNGKFLASFPPNDPKIKLWDVERKDKRTDLTRPWTAHAAIGKSDVPIQQLAFSPDEKFLASAGLDTTTKIWSLADVNNPKLVADLIHIGEQFGVAVSAVEYSNGGKLLATGDFQGVVRIWETGAWKLVHEFRASETSQFVQTLRFSPDDTMLAAAVEMGIGRAGVNLFDIKSLPAAPATSPSVGNQLTDEPPLIDSK